ncbi:MAG: methionine biosynthesis protein MetW [Methyloligellaceae bacterium]
MDTYHTIENSRVDHLIIADMVQEGSRVLDIGCGDGALLELLRIKKSIDGRGIEINQPNVNLSVAKGLSVIHGDADHDLTNYPDGVFDYAILSQTIQATMHPKTVLEQLLRISDKAIVSFPNFGAWKIRMQLLLTGRMPTTKTLPQAWYETQNIHLCTIKDFVEMCKEVNAKVEKSVVLDSAGNRISLGRSLHLQNLFGVQAVFLLRGN